MSSEVYFAEMSHFPPFSPPPFTRVPLLNGRVCGRAYIKRIHVRICAYMCACARGAVALCPASPGCRHTVSGKVKLQTAAFSVALKDGVSLGGTLGMCVAEFV